MKKKAKTTPARRNDAAALAKQEGILAAAIDVICEKGYYDASMYEIAAQAGVATGSLYFYFQEKQDILFTIVLSFLQELLESVREAAKEKESQIEQLSLVAAVILDSLTKDEKPLRQIRVLREEIPDFLRVEDEVLKRKAVAIKLARTRIFRVIDDIITGGQAKKIFNCSLPVGILRTVLIGGIQGLAWGLSMEALEGRDAGYDNAEARKAVKQLVSALVLK